ncbi:MAG: YtxH domain-containing protein [Rikenellaceae bacterium]
MKKTGVILTSIIGGAIVGSAVTMCLCPKSGSEFRRDAHKKIIAHIEALKARMQSCCCGDEDKQGSEEDEQLS